MQLPRKVWKISVWFSQLNQSVCLQFICCSNCTSWRMYKLWLFAGKTKLCTESQHDLSVIESIVSSYKALSLLYVTTWFFHCKAHQMLLVRHTPNCLICTAKWKRMFTVMGPGAAASPMSLPQAWELGAWPSWHTYSPFKGTKINVFGATWVAHRAVQIFTT